MAPNTPAVHVQMMIRKPVEEVFNAFINPEITTNFWFTKSSGTLVAGTTVTWSWEMYGASGDVLVKEIEPNKKISIEWDNPVTTVDFIFESLEDGNTLVIIKNYGFQQTGPELINKMMDSTGGFTTVIDGCKAYLEHGSKLNLVADKFPSGH